MSVYDTAAERRAYETGVRDGREQAATEIDAEARSGRFGGVVKDAFLTAVRIARGGTR